jgi:hypothetical protein
VKAPLLTKGCIMSATGFQRMRRAEKAKKYKTLGIKSVKAELKKAGIEFDPKAGLEDLVTLCVERL